VFDGRGVNHDESPEAGMVAGRGRDKRQKGKAKRPARTFPTQGRREKKRRLRLGKRWSRRTERAEVIIVDRGRGERKGRRRWMGEIIGRTESEIDRL
jgi:hypothetical protein